LILVDANILMYAAGSEHPNRVSSIRFLERVARGEVEAAVDAGVFQEILHRYRAIERWQEGCLVYDSVRQIFPVCYPITVDITDEARSLLDTYQGISARDALHASVVLMNQLDAICSFDSGFDQIRGVTRAIPDEL
jgi:predicted nucleic acid-binding protein